MAMVETHSVMTIQIQIRRLLLPAILLIVAGLGLAGCALTQGQVDISYAPSDSGGTTKIAGAQAIAVSVSVDDERTTKDTVGHKSNGFGMEMAPIKSNNDVPQTLQSAISTELKNRDFTVAQAGVPIAVTLTKFDSRFQTGLWSGTAKAEVVMNVTVKDLDGNIVYTKLIDAEGLNEGIELASADNAQIALDRALQKAMADLFADNNFIAALETANKGATLQAKAAHSDRVAAPLISGSTAISQPVAVPSQ
jgi:uncharacterized lipoprotein YajG